MFVITGDPGKHGPHPPVLIFSDGATFVFANPLSRTVADVVQFLLLADAIATTATIPSPGQIVEISGVGVLKDQLNTPISILPTTGKVTKPVIS